jgi:hypothetical protein
MRLVPPVSPTNADQPSFTGCRVWMHRSTPMLDVLMLALGFGLFALAIGYTYACERL